jgi:hypothetical protein
LLPSDFCPLTSDYSRFRQSQLIFLEGLSNEHHRRSGKPLALSGQKITLDPDTGEKAPALLKKVAQAHSGMAGVYGAVLVEGTLRKGDAVELLD